MSTAEGQLSAAISNAVVHFTREYTGRGPTKARTTIGNDMVVTRLEDTLTKGERSLADSGKRDMVLDIRRCFQMTMRQDLVAEIEKLDRPGGDRVHVRQPHRAGHGRGDIRP